MSLGKSNEEEPHLSSYSTQSGSPRTEHSFAINSEPYLTSFKKQPFSPTYQLGPYTVQRSSTHSQSLSGQSREDDSRPDLSSYPAQSTSANAPFKQQNEQSFSKSSQLGSYNIQSTKNFGPYTVQKFSSHSKVPSRASRKEESDPSIGSYAQSVKSDLPFEPTFIINSQPHLAPIKEQTISIQYAVPSKVQSVSVQSN